MGKRITIDPITRIEGHLRIDCEVNNGKVSKAWASGQMWRGVEQILLGHDARDAWAITQRICGVCTTVHAITSVRAVENALQMEIPLNAQYIRNMIITAHAIHDHIVHFYHLSALDWVDVTSALKADPGKTASLASGLSSWSGNSKQEFTKVKERLARFRRHRPARHLHQRLLGPPGNEAAARSEPAGDHALPASAGDPALRQQDRERPRFQIAAHPEHGRGRRLQPDRTGFAIGIDHRAPAGDQGMDRQTGRFREERLSGRRCRCRRVLCRLDQDRRRRDGLPAPCPTCRSTPRAPSSPCPAATSRAATWPASNRSSRSTTPTSATACRKA